MVLVAVMCITMLANPMIYLKFKLNQDYIAKVLCVNKARPQLKCNGHCYLAKQLKKAQQEESSAKKMLEQMNGFQLFCVNNILELPFIQVNDIEVVHTSKVQFSVQEHFLEINQPPCIV